MALVPDVLDATTPTLRDVAVWVQTPYPTVRSWRAGDRNPSADATRKLVRALRRHCKKLQRFADRLERSILEVSR